MKLRYYLMGCILLTTFLISSCKKNNEGEDSTTNGSIKVKYELTTSLPINSDPTFSGLTSVAYVNSTMNIENVTGLMGKTWTKEFTIEKPKKGNALLFQATLFLVGNNGTANGKIYINGVVKSEVNETSGLSSGGSTTLVVIPTWTIE